LNASRLNHPARVSLELRPEMWTVHPPDTVNIALKLASFGLLLLVGTVYWRAYGPTNFLWLSDIGLVLTVGAIVLESRVLASMAAVGVLALELAWTADFVSGGRLLGIASYMFDEALPLHLRALSLFHLAVPPAVVWLLYRFGYDPRALGLQTGVTWVALIMSYALTEPAKNINWVFGPGREPQQTIAPLAYFAIEMVVIPVLVLFPTHLLLRWMFPVSN
jgi:hypothetical protein